MSDIQKWEIFHHLCDAWSEENGYENEQAFMAYVSKITREMGL